MPMYEYHCEDCDATFEQLRKMSDADKELECPYCKSIHVVRQISVFATGGCGSGGGGGFT